VCVPVVLWFGNAGSLGLVQYMTDRLTYEFHGKGDCPSVVFNNGINATTHFLPELGSYPLVSCPILRDVRALLISYLHATRQ